MNDNLQLVTSETESVGQQIKWIETDSVDLSNLLKLLIRSQENESDQSIKNVLDICIDKIENLISIEIPEVNKSIKKIISVLNSIELDASKAQTKTKRTPRKTNSNNKTSKNKVVDIVTQAEHSVKDDITLVAK